MLNFSEKYLGSKSGDSLLQSTGFGGVTHLRYDSSLLPIKTSTDEMAEFCSRSVALHSITSRACTRKKDCQRGKMRMLLITSEAAELPKRPV